MLNSLSFCLSIKLLNSPSYLNEILSGYSNPGCRLFSFITLSLSCHSLLAWRVSLERSAVILMGIPLCVICCFSLAAFNLCVWSLLIWLICVLGCFALSLSCLGLSGFLGLVWLLNFLAKDYILATISKCCLIPLLYHDGVAEPAESTATAQPTQHTLACVAVLVTSLTFYPVARPFSPSPEFRLHFNHGEYFVVWGREATWYTDGEKFYCVCGFATDTELCIFDKFSLTSGRIPCLSGI